MFRKLSLIILTILLFYPVAIKINKPTPLALDFSAAANKPLFLVDNNTDLLVNTAKRENTTLPLPLLAINHPTLLQPIKNSFSFANQATVKLLALVNNAVHHLNYNHYRLGGAYFNSLKGVYEIDCSSYVDHLLTVADPAAYVNIKNGTGCYKPNSEDYYAFFSKLPINAIKHDWYRVTQIQQLKPGDILVFRYKSLMHREAAGHVMVVMDPPKKLNTRSNAYQVRVSDAAPSGHSHDTRPSHTSGIGIGTLLLNTDPKTGAPYAYAWKLGAPWEYDMYYAMARPMMK